MLGLCRKNLLRKSSVPSFRGSKTFSSIVDKVVFEHDTIESVDKKLELMAKAHEEFAKYDQEQVDKIFHAVAHAASTQRIYLAKLANAETGMGLFEDKVVKNTVACELTLSKYKDSKTVGVIEQDSIKKLTKIAVPVGPIASLIPVTNPTSTTILKSLFALKTRNGMAFLPHLKSPKCTLEAARICSEAAVAAGAPDHLLPVIYPTREISQHVMHHEKVNLLLATGGPSMVHACYESGKPAIGVGAGNAAVLIDETADLNEAVGSIVVSKTFDNGVICASEQSVVIVDSVYDEAKEKFQKRGVHFVVGDEKTRLGNYLVVNGHINPDIVGQSAKVIAERVGLANVPQGTVVLAAEVEKVGVEEPLSYEKLSPLLSFYRASDYEGACQICQDIVNFGGKGHTSAIYTHDKDRIISFSKMIPAFHLMVNMPTALGAIGTAFNFNVDPSLTLGVGSIGGSSLAGSLTPMHLIDIKTVAEKQEHMEWMKSPPAVYFNRNCTEEALDDLSRTGTTNRVLIITDKVMGTLGHVQRIENSLKAKGIMSHVFDDVNPDPDMNCIRSGVKVCESFKPDTIICLGGGSPMDAGKCIRVLYENPHVTLSDLAARFIELRKRTHAFPHHGKFVKKMVCIPTTSGTASEVTPFSVVTDDQGHKYPLCSYEMTPDIAIVDSSYCDQLPRDLIAHAGVDAITHAIESYVSVVANNFTQPMSKRALKLVAENLVESHANGTDFAREQVHHGATIAGMAFSNSFLGVCHSLSHQVGGNYHLSHGLVNAVLLPYVIEYNATDAPTRMTAYPTYTHPMAISRYAELATALELGNASHSDIEKVQLFVEHLQTLNKDLGIANSFQAIGLDEADFMSKVEEMSEFAFDDQCSGANPRFPIATELREILKSAYYGHPINVKK